MRNTAVPVRFFPSAGAGGIYHRKKGGKSGMRLIKKLVPAVLCTALLAGCTAAAYADASDTYVSMGADLTVEQRAKVLELMDLTEEDLAGMDVVQITNEKEHEMLGGYLPNSVIGSRALSCVRVDKKKSDGIKVTTKNITYCTEGMYQNALITAGIENADVIVAGPTNISGTAGLVGAMEAYQEMTGKTISEENQDAAVNEIVATGDLADNLGSTENAENLMALVKQKVISADLSSDEDILKAIEDAAAQIDVTLSDAEKQQILSLMKKIGNLDIDVDALKQQASDIYDRLKNLGVDMSDLDKDTVVNAIAKFFQGIIEFFKGLFS